MTERKLTDEDVIKALEKALTDVDAPIGEHWGCGFLTTQNIKDTLDLINRQKAEIERYEAERQEIFDKCTKILEKLEGIKKSVQIDIAMAKSEAIKEFAEELKYEFNVDASANFNRWIDKKVKEKTEKNKGQSVPV